MESEFERSPSLADIHSEEAAFLAARSPPDQESDRDVSALDRVAAENPVARHLFSQLGVYDSTVKHGRGIVDLSRESKEKLYQSVTDYPYGAPSYVFRKQFILYVYEITETPETNYSGLLETRETRPEDAAITMRALLKPRGVELYKLALSEEMYSSAYREAVFNESTIFIEGPQCEQPPAIIIAGPSASGKSSITPIVIAEVHQLSKQRDGNNGNLLGIRDGGIWREVSQMRKLVLRAAYKKGYTGIRDLESYGEVLEDLRSIITKTLLSTRDFGIVIPETFSDWIVPGRADKSRGLMRDLSTTDRQLIFTVIEGSDPKNFQSVVEFMGATRAWKTKGFENLTLDLNSRNDLFESKAYGPYGFRFGKYGSNSALEAYVQIQKQQNKPWIVLRVENDLMLVREVGTGEQSQWGSGRKGESGVVVVSQRLLTKWDKLPADQKAIQGWLDYVSSQPNNMRIKRDTSQPRPPSRLSEELPSNLDFSTATSRSDSPTSPRRTSESRPPSQLSEELSSNLDFSTATSRSDSPTSPRRTSAPVPNRVRLSVVSEEEANAAPSTPVPNREEAPNVESDISPPNTENATQYREAQGQVEPAPIVVAQNEEPAEQQPKTPWWKSSNFWGPTLTGASLGSMIGFSIFAAIGFSALAVGAAPIVVAIVAIAACGMVGAGLAWLAIKGIDWWTKRREANTAAQAIAAPAAPEAVHEPGVVGNPYLNGAIGVQRDAAIAGPRGPRDNQEGEVEADAPAPTEPVLTEEQEEQYAYRTYPPNR